MKTGANAVGPDALCRILHGDVLGELVDGAFGRAVGDARIAEIAPRGDKGDIDDRSGPLRFHERQDVLAGEVHALQVDVDHFVPAVFRYLDRAADFNDADIVVQDVDAAEAGGGVFDEGGHLIRSRDIRLEHGDFATLIADDAGGLLSRLTIDVGRDHFCAFARIDHRGRLTVAPSRADRTGACDDRHPVLEPLAHGHFSFASAMSFPSSASAM